MADSVDGGALPPLTQDDTSTARNGHEKADKENERTAPSTNYDVAEEGDSPSKKRKRKPGGPGPKFRQGSAKNGRGQNRKDMGRNEYSRSKKDRRGDDVWVKRPKVDNENLNALHPKAFTQEEINAEGRKPKKKVAVLIGYSGTGYHGLQISPNEKTIEGDLFKAFIEAGAISKANANDPKKSSLVRCARTDRGVHAAGNMISLKLILENENIVEEINKYLPSQIRVWGIQRTTGGFSCYQACDSRWYEYLIPTHSFLPPPPTSALGKKLEELAEEVGDLEAYHLRQAEVETFWANAESQFLKPALDKIDLRLRPLAMKALYVSEQDGETVKDPGEDDSKAVAEPIEVDEAQISSADQTANDPVTEPAQAAGSNKESSRTRSESVNEAIRRMKAAFYAAKEAYRISPTRLERVRAAFGVYVGTRRYHNYTIRKAFSDPSVKRHIKSFTVSDPMIIGGTEWVSLKVHGQSFMMHQIRKMVTMAVLAVRCGRDPEALMMETFQDVFLPIPKAPGLGLLLERPVFNNYNISAAAKFGKEPIDYDKYEEAIRDFKQREIYDQIFSEEIRGHFFHAFFSHVDNYKRSDYLYLSSKGLAAVGDLRGEQSQSARQAALKAAEGMDREDGDDEAADEQEA